MSTNQNIVIIGAGPTGLGAGYRLKELGYDQFQIYERSNHVGGLARSFTDEKGFTWDVGGHVMFSHYQYYDQVFHRLMGNDFQLNMRESWVRMMNTWIPYPFQNNIRYLPREAACECLLGLIEAQTQRNPQAAENFEQFIDSVFGQGIARLFMKPYNFKVWAHPPHMLNKSWIGERIAVIDIKRAIANVMLEKDDFGWGPNNQFKFPLFGGTGEFYKRFNLPLRGHIQTNREVAFVNIHRKEINFSDGAIVPYDVLISTVPLDIFCGKLLNGAVPRDIKTAARSLRHSGGHMVGIGIEQPCPSTRSWMYFPEADCPFYRVTYLSNYSPNMTPDNSRYYSLLTETSFSEFKPVDARTIEAQTIQGLVNCGLITEEDRETIVDVWKCSVEYSYPTPTVERDQILSRVIPYLEKHGIYSRGRFGIWKYEVSNTDHSLMQGVELVNRLLLGEPETTIAMKYTTTVNGRNAAVHERVSQEGHISEEELGIAPSQRN